MVSLNTTPPEISIEVEGVTRAPSPRNEPLERKRFTDSSGMLNPAENRHRCSGKALNASCPARSTTRMAGSLRFSPRSGVFHPSWKSTSRTMEGSNGPAGPFSPRIKQSSMMMCMDSVVQAFVEKSHSMLMGSLPWLLANITSTVARSEPPFGSSMARFNL